MREIKFRGYSKRIEKWIYGCLLKYWCKEKEDFVDDKVMIVSQNNNNYYEVEEDSIGQYTGFKCINGTKIYEGDILSSIIDPVHRYIITWSRGHWVAKDTYDLGELFFSSLRSDVQVVGNVYIDKLKEKERI